MGLTAKRRGPEHPEDDDGRHSHPGEQTAVVNAKLATVWPAWKESLPAQRRTHRSSRRQPRLPRSTAGGANWGTRKG